MKHFTSRKPAESESLSLITMACSVFLCESHIQSHIHTPAFELTSVQCIHKLQFSSVFVRYFLFFSFSLSLSLSLSLPLIPFASFKYTVSFSLLRMQLCE